MFQSNAELSYVVWGKNDRSIIGEPNGLLEHSLIFALDRQCNLDGVDGG